MVAIDSDAAYHAWMTAGNVAARALQYGRTLCVPGARLVDVVHGVEERIRSEGLGMAFPCTVSLNACAAHFTPPHDDGTVLREGDLVKLDCGAELDGALSDNALTVEVGGGDRHRALIECAQACLQEAVSIIGPNVNLGDVGAAIELTAKDHGFRPIQNLTGHSLEPFDLHAGLTVPNVGMRVHRRPRIGDVLACEPFVTDGTAGRVENSGPGNIYHFQRARPQRMPTARRLMDAIERRHPRLPFAERWLTDAVDAKRLQATLGHLQRGALIKHYPALSEASKGMVAQAEATLIVTEDGCVVSTDPDTPFRPEAVATE